MDNDGHPDLIVGAKDMAVVLRARPIISISSEITVTGKFDRSSEVRSDSELDKKRLFYGIVDRSHLTSNQVK